MKIYRILILVLAIFGAQYAGAAVNAYAFMKEASALLTNSKSITASFKIESAGQESVIGTIAVKADKFAVKTSVSSTVYNGKTQWTVSTDDREISIFEPTPDEVAQINPFAIIRSYERDYSLKTISSNASTVKMQLTPKSKGSSIKSIIITFAAPSKHPMSMAITLDDGTLLKVTISDIKTNVDIPASRFTITKKDYPGYEIIDLR